MSKFYKYLYIIPGAILLFFSLSGILSDAYSIKAILNDCVAPVQPGFESFIPYPPSIAVVYPYIYLYIVLTLFYLWKKSEPINRLTTASVWVCALISILPTVSYVELYDYKNIFIVLYVSIPIIAFLYLLIRKFNKFIFIICLLISLIVWGGIKVSKDNIRECPYDPYRYILP